MKQTFDRPLRTRRAVARRWLAGAFAASPAWLLLLGAPSLSAAEDLDSVIGVRNDGTRESAKSQVRIDSTADQTDQLIAEYRSVLSQVESLRVYNRQLEKLVAAQEAEMASLGTQIDSVVVVGRQITPLMLSMVESLEEFVKLDVPFLPNERSNRIENLRSLMERADVSDAEKYRSILEAYQIENDYGRTLGTYKGDLDFGGAPRKVDFLRLGRVALVYQTPDGAELGAWDKQGGRWISLPSEYRNPIRKGIRIALKQAAPDLIRLPVPAPEDRR